jgi:integrase
VSNHRLTDLAIKKLPLKAKPYDKKDTEVRGMRVRVLPSGQKTFVLLTRYPGSSNPTRRALGEYGVMTLEEAREKAREWRKLIGRGVDPAAQERLQRVQRERTNATTFRSVAEAFFQDKLASQRQGREAERDIRKVFIDEAGWGSRPITEITALDVRSVIKRYKDAGKIHHAHNVLSYARRVFNWAIDQQVYAGLETSPCDRLKPLSIIGPKTVRTRVLSDAELRAAWMAAKRMGYPWGPLFELLLLTGQRKSEVGEMRWSEIDLAKKLWIVPAERMKADAAHVVPLSDDVVAVLASLPRFDGDYVFSVRHGVAPVSGYDKHKKMFDAEMLKVLKHDDPKAKLPDFVIHDLRRTVRTRLSAIPNISDLVRELVIGHTKPGLHKVYDQYAYIDEKRFALDAWAAKLRSIVNPPASNIVELRGAQ